MHTRQLFFVLIRPGIVALILLAGSLSLPMLESVSALAQYTSQSHVIGFGSDGMFVSNANYALHVEFVGANNAAPTSAQGTVKRDGAPTALTQVSYPNLWDGITLVYDAPAQGILRSTYTLAPLARVENIALRYNAPITVNPDGSLTVAYTNGQVNESPPVAWQERDGVRVPVSVAFVARGEREVAFAVGAYDTHAPLVIDPVLTWNTFLGGNRLDSGWGIALDNDGNVYISGFTTGTWGTPVRPFTSGQDAFVAKLDGNGSLLWNTFLGGIGSDTAIGVATGNNGHVYVAGGSNDSWGTPVHSHSGNLDTFVAELDSDGTLLWNTFAGGTDYDYATGVALDADGNIYISGASYGSWGTPVRAFTGGSDGFAAKLEADGDLTWNTFLGSADFDEGNGIAVESNGNVYVSGRSEASWGTPVRAYMQSFDAFVAKLDTNGGLSWNTFLGGNSGDHGYGIAVDVNGNVLVTGSSLGTWGTPINKFTVGNTAKRKSGRNLDAASPVWSPSLSAPLNRAHQMVQRPDAVEYDAFAAKLGSDGTLTWNTFLGGSNVDGAIGIAADVSGNVYVAGYSYTTWGIPIRPYTAKADGFAAKLDADGNLDMNTFLGGAANDAGTGIAVNPNGDIYLRGNSASGWGGPVRAYTNGFDAFVSKIPAAAACDGKAEKPLLLKPRNNSYVNGPNTKLDWGDTACATTYKVIVRQDSPAGEVFFQKGNFGKSQTIISDLVPGKSYYWRVLAINSFGKTKSAWFKITVATQNATVIVRNLTGGTLCYEILNTGIGKKCYPNPGDSLYGTFLAGIYTWEASAPCGTDSNTLYYPPQTITHWFKCDDAAPDALRSRIERGGTMK